MSIAAINEQLLRAIGVGVALVHVRSGAIRYANDTFGEWFGPIEGDAKLSELLAGAELGAALQQLETSDGFTTEVSFKRRRRSMTVAIEGNRALDEDENIAVLVCQNISRIKELESMIDSYAMMVERNTHEIRREKEHVEKLLLNMMPRTAYEEYKSFGVVAPRLFENVTVLTLGFANFGQLVADQDPAVIVSELNDVYTAFDRIGEQFGCERVRTAGDSYFTVSGVPDPVHDHTDAVCNAALRFLRYLEQRNTTHPIRWTARIGIATGTVIGSVVGVQKYIYDVFGPAVSLAQGLQSAAPDMRAALHPTTAAHMDDRFAVDTDGGGDFVLLGEAPVARAASE